jgi:hypothetical protein
MHELCYSWDEEGEGKAWSSVLNSRLLAMRLSVLIRRQLLRTAQPDAFGSASQSLSGTDCSEQLDQPISSQLHMIRNGVRCTPS